MYKMGHYLAQESPLHRRDPRIKIIGVITLSIIILQVEWLGLLAVVALILAATSLAHLSLEVLLQTVRPVLPFFAGLFLLYIFFTPGPPLPPFPIGPVQISLPGLYLGLLQVGKFLLLVLAASILTLTTRPSDLTQGLQRLLSPLKIVGISSHDLALMISLALRFMPLLGEEIDNVSAAQMARGANFNPHRPSGKIRAIGWLAAPLALNILHRSDELVEAMESRGYHPGTRTYLRELVFDRTDYGLLGFLAVIAIIFWYGPI